MKFLVVIALCTVAASANLIGPITAIAEIPIIQEIIAAINHPNTDPATAAALQQMLDEILANGNSIDVGPAIVDGEYEDISVGPAIVDESVVSPASSPLVQIIINVKPNSGRPVKPDAVDFEDIHGLPVIVDKPDLIIKPIIVEEPEMEKEPVNVVDMPERH